MSAPVPDSPSISSSGYNDGLGRREIAFDRETGTLLERLYVRPDIAVFDTAISGRVDRLQSLVDERFARPIAVERDYGRVVVVSEYVSGVRISELLENPDALQDAPTLDLALGFLLEALPALETFHATTGVPHGLLSSGRTVLASAPKVVFLDTAFGDVLGRLHYSRTRLWREFGLAMPQSAGPSRATVSSDIGQVALIALMLVLGRAILENEYLKALPGLVSEVSDVALIRGTEAFAAGLQQFLETALPISNQGYQSAQNALADVQRVVQLEMGAAACTRALTSFIEQIDVGAQPLPAAIPGTPSIEVIGINDDAVDVASGDAADELPVLLDSRDDTTPEQEIRLDLGARSVDVELPPPAAELERDLSFAVPAEGTDLSLSATEPAPIEDVLLTRDFDTSTPSYEDAPVPSAIPETYEEPRREEPAPEFTAKTVEDPWSYRSVDRSTPAVETVFAKAPEEATNVDLPPVTDRTSVESPAMVEPPLAAEPAEPAPAIEPAAAAEDEEDAEPARSSFFSPRRKRGEKSRSVRARKDKLRSAAAAFKDSVIARVTHQSESGSKAARDADARTPVPEMAKAPEIAKAPDPPRAPEPRRTFEPPPDPPRPKPMVPPLIPASRAAAFEPPIPEAAAPPAPRPFSTPIAPVSPPAPITPVAPAFEPPSPPMPSFSAPAIPMTLPAPPQPAAPIQLQGAPPISLSSAAPAAPAAPTLKLKTPVAPPRQKRYEPPPAEFQQFPVAADPGPRQFPWKLAAAAVVIMLAGVVAGRAYLTPVKKAEEQRAAKDAVEFAANTKLPPAKRGAGPVRMGKVTIETDTPGTPVLLDTVPIGTTPVTVERPVGKYTLTVGPVSRRIVIEAGNNAPIHVPLTSGWVAIFAPITFDVFEGGKYIGNTEADNGRVMLGPGRHELTLTNKALGYSAVHTVDIQSTEVVRLTVEPKGRANFNASPDWAEVWLDEKKLDDTPFSQELPLGVHTFVFKHREYGERKVPATIRADRPAAVSVDFNKPQ